jgi:hypothetical protein
LVAVPDTAGAVHGLAWHATPALSSFNPCAGHAFYNLFIERISLFRSTKVWVVEGSFTCAKEVAQLFHHDIVPEVVR